MRDISPDWNGSTRREIEILDEILRWEATPIAITKFNELCKGLGDYWYWFTLSTLWVSYSGWSDLNLWRKLFRANRRRRETSIMKPSEHRQFRKLPAVLTAYRAHRIGETDWISYTTDHELAKRWAAQRGGYVKQYRLKKKDCIALFLRRGENELLMLEPKKAKEEEGGEEGRNSNWSKTHGDCNL